MARTKGGEKRKVTPHKKLAMESSYQQPLRDEGTENSAKHEDNTEIEITLVSSRLVTGPTGPPSVHAIPVDKSTKKPTKP